MRGGAAPWRIGGDAEPSPRPLRTSWLLFAGSFIAIGVLMLLRLTTDRARPLDWALLVLLVVTGLLAVRHQVAVRELEAGRRVEAEGFARMLRGLSRSVSPGAIVTAIVDELGDVTGADHVVVVQRRAQGRGLEATLVSSRAGVPNASTLLPPISAEPSGTPAAGLPLVAVAPALALVGGPRAEGDREDSSPGASSGTVGTVGTVGVASATSGVAGLDAESTSSPRVAAPAQAAEQIADRVRDAYGLTNTLSEPLMAGGEVVGAIVLSRRTPGPWPASAARILRAAASEASAAFERAYSHREAETAASTDALTGLPNRRYFDEFCGLLARRRRADDAVGVLMIDVDRFKTLNDRHGHAVGDEVLREVAGAIAGTVREADVPARYGGEEFAVLLRNPSRKVALEVAERVRLAVRAIDAGTGLPPVSVSVGVAVAQAPNQPIGDLIEQADRALYRAKRAGRDRVIAA